MTAHGIPAGASDERRLSGSPRPALSAGPLTEWLHVLEVTGRILLVPPYFENFGKRLIKSPKLYVADSGLACHFLGITGPAELNRSPFLGPLFEGFVASELVKHQANQGRRREPYHFRDKQGLEADFLFPAAKGGLWMVECRRFNHRATAPPLTVLAPGIQALDLAAFVAAIGGKKAPAEKQARPKGHGPG